MEFTNSTRALKLYDERMVQIDALLANVSKCKTRDRAKKLFNEYTKRKDAAVKAVQFALYLDTKDRNRECDCYLVHPETIRNWCASCSQ